MTIREFTDLELFDMFNVDITPDAPHNKGDRRPSIEEPYVFNDIRTALWSKTKRSLNRGERNALQPNDHVADGVTTEPPGSSRVADLAAFYQTAMLFDEPPSPFNTDDE